MTELFHLQGGGTENRGSQEDAGDCQDKRIGNCYRQRSPVSLHAPNGVNLKATSGCSSPSPSWGLASSRMGIPVTSLVLSHG